MKLYRPKAPEAIRFGTDGWRAIIADQFTFANLERVAQAYADYLRRMRDNSASSATDIPRPSRSHSNRVVVGHDRRFLSREFAVRAAEIFAGNELDLLLFDEDVPTPLVSWAVREKNAAGGIVITASHNPPEFNGFKIKASWGGSASVEMTRAVETFIDASPPVRRDIHPVDHCSGTAEVISSYRRHLSEYVDIERILSAKIHVAIDPMHGTGGQWVESFLKEGPIRVETVRGERDATFGGVNPEPIDSNLGALKSKVLDSRSTLGLATDGDADRLGVINELGETMTMHQVVPLLLLHLLRNRQMTGEVVTTISQSVLTKRIALHHGLAVHETAIGFKYIAEKMLTDDILIGAEESGGIGVKGHIPERDGILNSLLFLEAVVMGGKPPSELVNDLFQEFGTFFFDRSDIPMPIGRGQDVVNQLALYSPQAIAGAEVTRVETLDGTKLIFADDSWLLFRQSGTEPVLRIYSEATSRLKLQNIFQEAVSLALKY